MTLSKSNPAAVYQAAAVPDSAASKAVVLVNAVSTHGYAAVLWAAGFFAVATVASILLINAGKHEPEAAEPAMAAI